MKFLEKEHSYIEDNEKYTPVTTFLKSFKPYVDWDKKCRDKAKSLGIPYAQLKAEWDKARNDGASRGTAFHKMMEDKYTGNSTISINNKNYPVYYNPTIENVKEDNSLELEDNTIYTEKMIWSKVYKICGTADLVEIIDGKIFVKDYKTNKKLDFIGWFNPRTGKTSKLLTPVEHLDNCNWNEYQLQLNIYMYMLLRHNRKLKIGGMQILHIKFNEDGTHETEVHEVENLQKEVKLMFEVYKSKK